jgi:hypothetical protein
MLFHALLRCSVFLSASELCFLLSASDLAIRLHESSAAHTKQFSLSRSQHLSQYASVNTWDGTFNHIIDSLKTSLLFIKPWPKSAHEKNFHTPAGSRRLGMRRAA